MRPADALPDPASLATAAAVVDAVSALYCVDRLPPTGILHVASAAPTPTGLHTLRITEQTPKSPWDAFALHLARARADVIVTTGGILRAEPELRYELGGPGAMPRGLAAYRHEVLGKDAPPALWVLTRGDVAADHPALHGWAQPSLIAAEDGLRALLHRSVLERPGVYAIEAGPSTHRALYDAPCLVDELALTFYDGPLDQALLGGAMPSESDIAARLGPARSSRSVGDFRFVRYQRRARCGE